MRLELYTIELTRFSGVRESGTRETLHFIAPAGMDVMRARNNRVSAYYAGLGNAQLALAELQSEYDDAD